MTPSRTVLLPLACAVALTLAGCNDDVQPGDGPGGSTLELPVGDVDLDVDAPAYSTGREIRIGEVTIPVDPTPDTWVVGPHGIYYLTDETLWFADEDGSEAVATVGYSELVLSPDRSLLGLADLASGPPDQFDTPIAVPVVFDLETGEEVLRGEPADATDEDLSVLYGEIEPLVLGFDDDAVYAVDPLRGGENRFPLDGGDPVELSDTEEEQLDSVLEDALPGSTVGVVGLPDGRFVVAPEGDDYAPYSAQLSPDGSWFYGAGSQHPAGVYDARTGRRTTLTDGIEGFGGWLADGSFYGIAVPPGGRPPEEVGSSYYPEQLGSYDAQVVVCPVDGTGCEPIDESFELPHPLAEDAVAVFPDS